MGISRDPAPPGRGLKTTLTFILTYAHQDKGAFDYKLFLVTRFARLWPVHVVTALATLYWLDTLNFWPATAVNFTLLHAWLPIPAYAYSLNWVSWSISDEVFFYILFPLIAFSPRISITLGFVALLVFAMLGLLDAVFSLPEIAALPPFGFSPFAIILQGPLIRILEFTAGIAAARLFLNHGTGDAIKRHPTVFEVVALMALLSYATTSEMIRSHLDRAGFSAFGLWYSQCGGFLIFAALIFVFANSGGVLSKALSFQPLVLLGEISFCTYMVHQVCIRYAVERGLTEWPWALVAAIYGLSYLLWRFVEVPSRKSIVHLYRTRRHKDQLGGVLRFFFRG